MQGLKAPAKKGDYDLIVLEGPGLFLGAHISKQGGATGLTGVALYIDNRNVAAMTFLAAHNLGLTRQNPSGIVLLGSSAGLQTFTIGWPAPLVFKKSLRLTVQVNETGVIQMVANVVRGTC